MRQREIFEEFSNLNGWSKQTLFIRSHVNTQPVKMNLEPIINLKKRNNTSKYHFIDEKGSLYQVCLSFFTKVLQIDQKKVFRAITSARKNPNAIECRGKSKNKNAQLNQQYAAEFIHKFVTYDSHHSSKQFLHPRLNIRKMYQLYQENCVFKKRNIVSDTCETK